MRAYSIGMCTLLGVIETKYPMKHGNCFDLENKDKSQSIKIVNFKLENLNYLLRNNIVSYPLEVKKLSKRYGILVDKRIPKDFFDESYCEICCPRHLLLEHQQKRIQAELDSGKRTEKTIMGDDGDMLVITTIKHDTPSVIVYGKLNEITSAKGEIK